MPAAANASAKSAGDSDPMMLVPINPIRILRSLMSRNPPPLRVRDCGARMSYCHAGRDHICAWQPSSRPILLASIERFGASCRFSQSACRSLPMPKRNSVKSRARPLRSQLWFDNPANPGMTALYLERYLNYGLTSKELRSGKPIIGIAQTGSDLSPCNRHHLELAKRVREGIRSAGGIAFEFPCHPIQETGKRPTAALDRNLAYLSLVEVLYGYPLDGVVLLTGCDKTTPACLMAAATVNTPAIVLCGGPMLNGWWKGERCGSGMAVWKAREELATGRIDDQEFLEIAAASAPSIG